MAFDVGYSENEATLTLNLCSFSYLGAHAMFGEKLSDQEARMRRSINQALSGVGRPDWQVVWGPALSDNQANMLYVAADTATNQMAVVIRGTVPTFILDWAENLSVLSPLQPFISAIPALASGNPQIAPGTNIGLAQIQALQGATDGNNQTDLVTFLRGAGPATDIFITGHSLGGCLASVLAPTLAFQLGSSANLKVYTFAAPSPGNADFATYYNRLFMDSATGKSTAFRLYNSLDVVPNAWASLDMVETYYVPDPTCTDEIRAVVIGAHTAVGAQYAQVGTDADGSAIKLTGSVTAVAKLGPLLDPIVDEQFFQQLLQQHATSMYQHLLNVPIATGDAARLRAAATS